MADKDRFEKSKIDKYKDDIDKQSMSLQILSLSKESLANAPGVIQLFHLVYVRLIENHYANFYHHNHQVVK